MDYHVAPLGVDTNAGTLDQPFRTIQRAAEVMQAGDTCYIRAGVYREWIKPPRGGVSEDRRITYAAYPGELPEIKGSERIATWSQTTGQVWQAVLPNSFFGSYNPYALGICGEWLEWTTGRHRGDVYRNGVPLTEMTNPAEVAEKAGTWAATVDEARTTLWAHFGEADPNVELVEINTRELVFFPEVTGLEYITVNGLALMHAANNWAPPESFQRGLIGVNWGSHWIIANCRISDAKCVGLSAGKFNPAAPPAGSREQVGHHWVHHNWIRRCGQAGIAGNMGFAFSRIEGNLIEDINFKSEFGGEETSGIKVHNAVDVTVAGNVIRRVFDARGKGGGDYPGIWIDWCNQGARITGNVVYDTDHYCIFLEACHGPLLVDNNIFVGKISRLHAKRIVLGHNLFADAGIFYQDWMADPREPGWYRPHTCQSAGSGRMRVEGNRFFNNIFLRSPVPAGDRPLDCRAAANLYLGGEPPAPDEPDSVCAAAVASSVTIHDLPNGARIEVELGQDPADVATQPLTHARIGRFEEIGQGIEDVSGRPVNVDTDIRNTRRDPVHPTVGPIEALGRTRMSFVLTAGPVPTGGMIWKGCRR
jgi:alpha-N-arabinofuranosidase